MDYLLTANLDGESRMQIADAVDFAPHIIKARTLIRDIHEYTNEGRNKEAEELALQLIVEAKLLLNAIKHK